MAERKIYCEVVEGVTYEERCLFKLAKVIEGNKTCEDCILRELERIKFCETKEAIVSPLKKARRRRKKRSKAVGSISKNIKKQKDIKESEDLKQLKDIKESFYIRSLIRLLGKSERTILEWAQKGKIPAYKIGAKWNFPKDEIERWLSEKGILSLQCHDDVHTTNMDSQGEDLCPSDQNVEKSLKTHEHE